MNNNNYLIMEPPAPPPQRRAIPRPWLQKQREKSVYAPPSLQPEDYQQQYQQHPQQQILISPVSFELPGTEPMVLLEKPDAFKSFFKMDWCCRRTNDNEKVQQESRPTFGVPVHQIYHTTATTAGGAPLQMIHQHHMAQQQQQQQPVLPPGSPHPQYFEAPPSSSFDDSSFRLAPRPTVIYVIQGNPSTIDGEGSGNPNWHQSYLSFAEESLQRPRAVQQRNMSFDTSMTSLSVDDSLAFSDDLRPQRRFSEDDIPVHPTTRRSSIPRPPRLNLKSKTTGTALLNSNTKNQRPPMVPPRPPLLHTRSSTTGSTTSVSSSGSRHRRSIRKLDRDILQRLQSNETEYDDDSTIATDGDSPIFPYLQSSSPRSQDSERKEEEIFMPKCVGLEKTTLKQQQQMNGDILLSGWVAYSMGDSLLHKRKLARKHLAYLVVYDNDPTSLHLLQQPPSSSAGNNSGSGERTGEDQASTSLKIPMSSYTHSLSVQTIESQGGRSVVIKQLSTGNNSGCKDKVLFTILPINLPASQFNAETGTVKRNLTLATPSVAQHDAALFLWFGLDGWMRRRQSSMMASSDYNNAVIAIKT